MDGVTLACVKSELHSLIGARIDKIYQPLKDEIVLLFKGNTRLLLSANASSARVQLTKVQKQNPDQAPMFCMLLRKHIQNGRIIAIDQPGFDRILHIKILAQDEIGDMHEYLLIAEIMGKHSNIVLVSPDQDVASPGAKIIDSIKHITPAISSYRNLMPGLNYCPPPPQDKADPLETSADEIYELLSNIDAPMNKTIMQLFSGLSPQASQEIAARISPQRRFCEHNESDKRTICERLHKIFACLKNEKFQPTLIIDDFGEPVHCFAYDSIQYAPQFKQPFETIFEALDHYNALKDQVNLIKQRGNTLQKLLQNNIDRCNKKLEIQHDILQTTDKIDELQLFGELLTANAHSLERGTVAVVQNYYDPGLKSVSIQLDDKLTPSQNAQKYYKKYNKAKAAFNMAHDQIAAITEELNYLEGQLDNLGKCTVEQELNEIRQELVQQGYLKRDKNKKIKAAVSKPMHYISSAGIDIYIGKNNTQNDYLTLKFAGPDDIWLHTKNIPGSHVIIKHDAPDDATLLEAANLALWYSKGRMSPKVAVDYTPRRYIKNPAAAPRAM